jgi:hypothetical protein
VRHRRDELRLEPARRLEVGDQPSVFERDRRRVRDAEREAALARRERAGPGHVAVDLRAEHLAPRGDRREQGGRHAEAPHERQRHELLRGRVRDLEQRARPDGADDRQAAERPLDVADVGEHVGRDADARGEARRPPRLVPDERAAPLAAERIAREPVHGFEHVGLAEPRSERLADAHEDRRDLRFLLGLRLRARERLARAEALDAAPLERVCDEDRRGAGRREADDEMADRPQRALHHRERGHAGADHRRRRHDLRPEPPRHERGGDERGEEAHRQRRVRVRRDHVRHRAAPEDEAEDDDGHGHGADARRCAAERHDAGAGRHDLERGDREQRPEDVPVDRGVGDRERQHRRDHEAERHPAPLDQQADRLGEEPRIGHHVREGQGARGHRVTQS